ncbi:MAG: glycosyltransferase family A protein [Planctomycetota bacterium]|nr:glycosyltransferase family A protein [Planctomycetota bacterium]
MRVTLAICTWNRADLLNVTLHSLAKLMIPAGVEWQVIVADNNSTDHTQRVLAKHAAVLPLTSLFVQAQGKSHALNAITERLAGDLVIWTDDDVLVDPCLIQSYVEAATAQPDAQFFGGWVVPRFLGAEPSWLRPAWRILAGVYAARELGPQSFDFTPKILPFGANMAARVPMQKQYRYDAALGRVGELLLAGEETALMQQWLSDGLRGVWVPNARVDHLITPERTELAHIRRFFFSLAQSKRSEASRSPRAKRLVRGALYLLQALHYELKSRLTTVDSNPGRWVKYQARLAYGWGRVDSQWHNFPAWMIPASVRWLQASRNQPRPDSAEWVDHLLAELRQDTTSSVAA